MFTVEIGDKEYRVWFRHLLEQEHFWGVGATQCFIEPEGEAQLVGTTFCSKKDKFSRKIGRYNALGRATSMLRREERGPIWSEYWKLAGYPDRA